MPARSFMITRFTSWTCRTGETGTGRGASRRRTTRPTTCAFARVTHAWAARCVTSCAIIFRFYTTCFTRCRACDASRAIVAQTMDPARFQTITGNFSSLRIAVIGDFCLDRYLAIDPARQETSIETGLPVHNVVDVRAQPGGAGTILNNLVALRIREIVPVGFCGTDGEGFELQRALR